VKGSFSGAAAFGSASAGFGFAGACAFTAVFQHNSKATAGASQFKAE
jgi:hypothetical protein